MKKMKFIFAISLAMTFATVTGNTHDHERINSVKPGQTTAKMVNYTVRVENADYLRNFGRNFLVMVTDETGSLVAPAQVFRPGVTDYQFFEGGTARGTRVAQLVQTPRSPQPVVIPPRVFTGIFYGGETYLFVIGPIPSATDPLPESR